MKRPNHSVSAAILVALAALTCERPQSQPQPNEALADSAAAAPSTAPNVAAPIVAPRTASSAGDTQPTASLACAPERLGPRDTLTLTMKTPHGDYLVVTDPDKTAYYIIYPRLKGPTRIYSLMPGDAFKELSTLTLAPDARAVAWEYQRDTILAPIFTKPGKYVVRMGEKLEGDYGGKSSTCTVTVVGDRR
jgi:hypothetical protein